VRRLAPLLVAAVLLGCGDDGPTDEEKVRESVRAFATAIEERDGAALCERVLAPELIDNLAAGAPGLPCERAAQIFFQGREDPRVTIGEVRVDGTTAEAEIQTSAAGEKPFAGVLELTKIGDEWRLADLRDPTEDEATATRTPGPAGAKGPTGPTRGAPTAAP
jgi:hypothetical protein